MTTATLNLSQDQKNAIAIVTTMQPEISAAALEQLVVLTSKIGGCSIVSIRNYNSKKSEGTELANHRVNIGAAYLPMVEKSNKSFADVTLADFCAQIDAHNFGKYVIVGSLEAFKTQVKDAFEDALFELKNPKTGTRVSNDIWLNKALVFNTNTLELCLFGQGLAKDVVVKGEFKPVKSAAKTVAKNIIKEVCKPKTDILRRFCVGLLTDVKVSGEEIEVY